MCYAVVLLLILPVSGAAESPSGAVVGRMTAPALREVSGIVRSRTYPGIFWVHNDSGNEPVLYAIRADGRLVQSFRVGAPNLDWEDIAIDDAGNLYLGDIGNNLGLLPIRTIYRLAEPDPNRRSTQPLPATPFAYRYDGPAFDAESLIIDGPRAIVLSKHRDGRLAAFHGVPLVPGNPLRPAPAKELGSLPGFTEPVTGADLSPDGRRLVVCSTREVAVYERGDSGSWTLNRRLRHGGSGVEAIAWDGADLLLASENRTLYRVRGSALSRPQR